MGEGEDREARSKTQAEDERSGSSEDCGGSESKMGQSESSRKKIALTMISDSGGCWTTVELAAEDGFGLNPRIQKRAM